MKSANYQSETYPNQGIIGFRELSELANYSSQRIIRVGELSESENCESQRIIQKLKKSQIAKPAANKIEYCIPFETF